MVPLNLLLTAILLSSLLAPPAETESPASAAGDFKLQFAGTQMLSAQRLRNELAPWLEDLGEAPDDVGVREDVIYEVVSIYRKNGFPDARVTIDDEITESAYIPSQRNQVERTIVISVFEGSRAYLQDFVVVGNTAIGDEALKGAFPWLRPGLLPAGRAIFTESALRSGVAAIKLLYSLRGYLDVKVTAEPDRRNVTRVNEEKIGPPEPEVDEIHMKVVVRVEEGTQTTLAVIDVVPGSITDPLVLRRLTGVAVGDPVTPRLRVEVQSRVRRRLQDLSYYLVQVHVELEDLGDHQRRLVLAVTEGGRYTFGSIIVTGNPRTRSVFIRDRLGIEFGEEFSATALETGQRALNATGLLKRFDLELLHSEYDQHRLDIVIDVEEREAIRLETRVGFSTYELGRLGVGALHRNLFGWGIEGRLEGLASFGGEELEARLKYPYLWDRGISLELRGKYRRFEEVSFERQETLGTVTLSFPVDRKLSFNTGFELRDEDVTDFDRLLDEVNESSRAHVVFVGGRHDDRDSPIATTEGRLFSGRFEYSDEAFGSDLDFLRVTLRGSHTQEISDRWGLVVALQLGLIDRLDTGVVPIGERFFLGGARSVRSFRQDRMPPRDEFGNEIGGEAFAVTSVELRPKLWGDFSGAIFLDGGSLTADVAEFAGRNWRFAGGLGLIWNSPVGPLRLDAGITLNPERGDDQWAIHVLLGQPF